jgi:hypothetical protein
MHGWTVSPGSEVRPSEIHWHMVFTCHSGRIHPIFVGPLTQSGVVSYSEGAEILWIQFKLGAFLSPLPLKNFLNTELVLPRAGSQSFWLNSSAWQFPDYANVETFVMRLAREEVLVQDPLVGEALRDRTPEVAPRTLRQRFSRATGLTQGHIRQYERAQNAERLLRQGIPILDAVFELGYYDQPHLTRSLKNLIGRTPAQIARASAP